MSSYWLNVAIIVMCCIAAIKAVMLAGAFLGGF